MIPNILHQIWIQGCDEIPEDLKKFHTNCQKINDKFIHMFWDDNKIRKLLIDNFDPKYLETYDYFKIPAQKADFARYAILYIYGGIYLDMDMVCRKNLEPLLQYNFFFTSYMFPKIFKRYLNGIIGSRKNHPIFLIIFKNIFERKNNSNDVTNSTGTGLFYSSVMEYVKQNPNHDLTVLDKKFLHPCNLYNDESCPYTCKHCYVAHTNYSSWSPSLRICKKILKNKYWILLLVLVIIFIIVILILKIKFV
uniref:Glycosyltransferase n=1 Tax=Borely moumouvirus TaxID=2712067 RepID=A0A6G6ABD4_9VIRU